jgi:hypothetical protein
VCRIVAGLGSGPASLGRRPVQGGPQAVRRAVDVPSVDRQGDAAEGTGPLAEAVQQRRLPDPAGTVDEQHAARRVCGQGFVEAGKLGVPAHEGAPVASSMTAPRACATGPG